MLCPAAANLTASDAARLVFPTPPLPLTITYLRAVPADSSSNAVAVGASSVAAAPAACARCRSWGLAGGQALLWAHKGHGSLPAVSEKLRCSATSSPTAVHPVAVHLLIAAVPLSTDNLTRWLHAVTQYWLHCHCLYSDSFKWAHSALPGALDVAVP